MTTTFETLGLDNSLLTSLKELGYETPTPIQAQSIPVLLAGDDILAQAQTGTGKTAAFALPILSDIDISLKAPQTIVLAPTRELAIQVAEAFQRYAAHLKDFHVMPIYGGEAYPIQIRALKRGPHVVVGTPGRVMDHLRRGTLKLDKINTLVLDEADEMLKMGFIDDVEWILEQMPEKHRTALFSATLPKSIQNIANRYLDNPQKIQIKGKTETVSAIEQLCIQVYREQKLDVLTRCLEIEDPDAALIFTRTKITSDELAEKLLARGYRAAALNGDVNQGQRKKVIDRLKNGGLDVVVATDVAARGIDVERISHVFNFDMPCDAETYIHRIGRTGRAGRKGTAFLFVLPREQRLLRIIEQTTRQKITQTAPPSAKAMEAKRVELMATKIKSQIESGKALKQLHFIKELMEEEGFSAEDIASALMACLKVEKPAVEMSSPEPAKRRFERSDRSDRSRSDRSRSDRSHSDRSRSDRSYSDRSDRSRSDRSERSHSDRSRSDRPDRSRSDRSESTGRREFGASTDRKRSSEGKKRFGANAERPGEFSKGKPKTKGKLKLSAKAKKVKAAKKAKSNAKAKRTSRGDR
jgi:ATP-dependent RNA helicase DeaD